MQRVLIRDNISGSAPTESPTPSSKTQTPTCTPRDVPVGTVPGRSVSRPKQRLLGLWHSIDYIGSIMQTPHSRKTTTFWILMLLAGAGFLAFLWQYEPESRKELAGTELAPSPQNPSAEEELMEVSAGEPSNSERLNIDPTTVDTTASAQTLYPINIELLDKETDQVLPAFRLGGNFDRRTFDGHRAETDSQGQVHWFLPDLGGDLKITLEDDPGIQRSQSLPVISEAFIAGQFAEMNPTGDLSKAPTRAIRIATGPTCFFDRNLPEGYSHSDVQISLLSGPRYTTHGHFNKQFDATLRPPHSDTLFPQSPWVRFGKPTRFRDLAWIELRTSDYLYVAGAWLPTLKGVHPEPLSVEWNPSTYLIGQFAWPADTEQDWAFFTLSEQIGPQETRVPCSHEGSAGSDGKFRIDFISPGSYRFVLRDKAWHRQELDVEIRPGPNDLGLIQAKARKVVGSVQGVIESTSGSFEGACHVSLSDVPNEHGGLYDHSIDFEDDGTGRLVAQFAFEDVTAGPWYLYVHCHDAYTWQELHQVVQAPADNLRIVLDDPTVEVEIRLVDAKTKSPIPIEAGSIRWSFGELADNANKSAVVIPRMPDNGQQFEYFVSAKGYQPREGTGVHFKRVPSPSGRGERLVGVLPLEPGWGTKLETRDRSRGGGVAGVRVLLDAEPYGVTDSSGSIWLLRPEAPGTIHVEKKGWRWLSSRDGNARSGLFAKQPNLRFALEQIEAR